MALKHIGMLIIIISTFVMIITVRGKIETAIPSGGIKSEVGSCHKKKMPNGVLQEHCYMETSGLAAYFERDQEEAGKSCKKFNLSDFDKNSPSIMYMEAEGRMGNQLLAYAMLLQLGYAAIILIRTSSNHNFSWSWIITLAINYFYFFSIQLDVSAYMDYDMKEQLISFFTPESITLPVLYDKYCNPEDIPWEMWGGKLADLLTNENLRKGRFLWLYKPKNMERRYR